MTEKTVEIKIFEHTSLSDTGLQREHNEDRYVYADTVNGSLFVLCDGMGGIKGGDVAAQISIDSIKDVCSRKWENNAPALLKNALEIANLNVRRHFADLPEGFKAGSTVVIVLIRGNKVYYAHIGDSRLYYKTGEKLYRLTKDDSFVQTLQDKGELTEKEARKHPRRNQITKAVGITEQISPSIPEKPLFPLDNDFLLLCSDGLNGMLTDDKINELLNPEQKLKAIAKNMTEAANDAGGDDNITVQIIRFFNTGNTQHQLPSINNISKINPPKKRLRLLLLSTITGISILISLLLFQNKNLPGQRAYPAKTHIKKANKIKFTAGNNILVYSFFYNANPDEILIANDKTNFNFRIGETVIIPAKK